MRRTRRVLLALLRALLTLALAAGVFAALRLRHVSRQVRDEAALRSALHGAVFTRPAGGNAPVHECPVDFAALRESCPGAVGWLSGCGGEIETPVVQGTDNTYYLDHLADGTPNLLGAAFLDCRNASRFSDDQSLVFGHHMDGGGGVFAPLLYYRQADYAAAHPAFVLHTQSGCYRAEVFAAFAVEESEYPYTLEFARADAWLQFTEFLRARSEIETQVPLAPADRVLTLCTCSAKADRVRFVVCTKLVPI